MRKPINLILYNHSASPKDLPIDEVSVTLAGHDTEALKFASAASSLKPGKTNVRLFCPVSTILLGMDVTDATMDQIASTGAFIHESSEIRMKQLLFQWSHRSPNGSSKVKHQAEQPRLVRIPRDLHAFDVRLRQSYHSQLFLYCVAFF